MLVEVCNGDIGTFAREQHCNGATDARVSTGNECDATGELAGATIMRRHVFGTRIEILLQARLAQMLLRERIGGILVQPQLHGLFLLRSLLLLTRPATLLLLCLQCALLACSSLAFASV